MATLKIRCPRCKNEFWVGEGSSEQIIECRNCQQKIRVPRIEKYSCGRFDVVIDSVPSEHRVDLIGTIREMQGLGLKEAMAFVDHLPLTFMENISTVESESVKKRLEEAGAVVHLEAYETPEIHGKKEQQSPHISQNSSTQKQQQKNHGNNCHEKYRSSSNTKATSKKPQHSSSSSSSDGCVFIILLLIVLGIVALILWLLWSFVTGMPRLAFWLIVSIFWIIYMACGGLKLKPLALLCLIGTIAWGWWAHEINSLSLPKKDLQQVAQKGKDGYQCKGKVSVTVVLDLYDTYNNKINPMFSIQIFNGNEIINELDETASDYVKNDQIVKEIDSAISPSNKDLLKSMNASMERGGAAFRIINIEKNAKAEVFFKDGIRSGKIELPPLEKGKYYIIINSRYGDSLLTLGGAVEFTHNSQIITFNNSNLIMNL